MDLIYITYHDNKPLTELGSLFIFTLELNTINQNEVEEFKPAIAINVVFPFFPTRILF
mgnify:FL=1